MRPFEVGEVVRVVTREATYIGYFRRQDARELTLVTIPRGQTGSTVIAIPREDIVHLDQYWLNRWDDENIERGRE